MVGLDWFRWLNKLKLVFVLAGTITFCSCDFEPYTSMLIEDFEDISAYKKMNFLGQGFQNSEHYRQTDRQRDRQTDRQTDAT